MGTHDETTLGFYAAEAEAYTGQNLPPDDRLNHFLIHLPKGAKILELGCGSGRDSAHMLALGYNVTPTDGTPEIARQAEIRLGRPVGVLLFEDICDRDRYDGIWANACLLHVPRSELAHVLAKIHSALKSGGVFYASFKSGSEEGRDGFDRYFNYPTEDWLRTAYGSAWQSLTIEKAIGSGYDQLPTPWLHVTAIR